MPKVSIIIPNWNSEKFICSFLSSLKKVEYESYNIIIVDNGSFDKSVELAKRIFSEVKIIKNDDNKGFATACNQGIKYALRYGAEMVLLLNNDTEVESDFLEKMVATAEDKKTGIVGCKINYYDNPKKIWFAGGRFVGWRASGQHMGWQKDDNDLRGEIKCDFVTGCVMLIKREVIEKIGYLYEPFFLSIEDLDFCLRARREGFLCKINLDARVLHKVSLSREGEFSFSNGYYGTRNRLYFAFKRWNNYFGGVVFLLIVLPFRIVQRLLGGNWWMVRGIVLGIRDFLKNKIGEY